MTDFVLEQLNEENSRTRPIRSVLNALEGYANFLKQPLKLEMFVPCDEKGNVLEDPYFDGENSQYYGAEKDYYEKAKEKVLFEGFEVIHERDNDDEYDTFEVAHIFIKDLSEWHNYTSKKTIEDLIHKSYHTFRPAPKEGYILTPTAIKQIGL